jgi:hypothetical protein
VAFLSDEWDRFEVPYQEPSRWRAPVARTIGILGILGTIALAVAAFAPRSHAIAVRFDALSSRVALPWDPELAPGPEPAPLDRDVRSSSAIVAAGSGVVPAPSSASASATTAELEAERARLAESEADEPTADVASAAQAAPTANAAAEPVTERVAQPVTEAAPRLASEAVPPRVRSAPREANASSQGFSEEEVQRRKDRYEAWLKEQGLERIH